MKFGMQIHHITQYTYIYIHTHTYMHTYIQMYRENNISKTRFPMFRNGGRFKLLHPVWRSNYTGDRHTLSGPWAGFSTHDILDSNY